MRRNWTWALVCGLAATLVSCGNNQEQDDLAKAQQCLDRVPQSNPTAADACLQYVAKYNSPHANKLKCSIYLTSGGLVEDKVVKAYDVLKNTTTNKEASYMAILSLDKPNVEDAYTKAVSASPVCQASGDAGFIYISSIVIAGTVMNRKIFQLTNSGIDISSPSSITNSVNTLLTECTAGDCGMDLDTLGSSAVAVANAYCGQGAADQDVCKQINSAVDAAGTDTGDVGQALMCYLKGMKYSATANAGAGGCVP